MHAYPYTSLAYYRFTTSFIMMENISPGKLMFTKWVAPLQPWHVKTVSQPIGYNGPLKNIDWPCHRKWCTLEFSYNSEACWTKLPQFQDSFLFSASVKGRGHYGVVLSTLLYLCHNDRDTIELHWCGLHVAFTKRMPVFTKSTHSFYIRLWLMK